MSAETRFRSGMLVVGPTSGSVIQCGCRCLVVQKYEVTCCEHVFNDVALWPWYPHSGECPLKYPV